VTDGRSTCSCHVQIRSDPSKLAEVRPRVSEVAESAWFDEKEVSEIILAVDEALANVIRHGYGGPCEKPIDILVARSASDLQEALTVSIRDYGKQFDPGSICGRPLDEVRRGGLGLHIMKAVMDEVNYAPADGGGMVLNMTKTRLR